MLHRMSMIRKAGLLLLALAVALSFSGCGRNNDESGPDSLLNPSTGSSSSGSLSSEEEGVAFEASLSYASFAYIDIGDESEDKLIRNVRQTLTVADTDEKLQIEAVLDALKSVPDDLSGAETFVSDAFTVNSMKFSGSSLVIDLSSDGLDELGMYDEEFFVYQVTDSILNTFPDLEAVRFTVDGTNKDFLSYVDISSPFTAADVKAFLKGEEEESSDEAKEESAAAAKKSSETGKKEESTKASDEEDEDDSQSGSEDSGSAKNSKNTKSSGSSDSNSSEKSSSSGSSSTESKASGSSSSGSSSSANQSQASSGNKKSSGSSSSNSSSTSGKKSGSTSGSQSSSSESSSSGSSTSSNSTASGVSDDSGNSAGSSSGSTSSSGGSSSSTASDGVVNDDDLQ